MSDVPPTIVASVCTDDGRWLRCESPSRILTIDDARDLPRLLADVERAARGGPSFVVGFVTYDAASAFALPTLAGTPGIPPAWFACFPLSHVRVVDAPKSADAAPFVLGPLTAGTFRRDFAARVSAIKARLAAGDTYQVNLTFPLSGPFSGDPEALFAALVERQPSRYALAIHTPVWTVLSVSPELFFARAAAPAGTPAAMVMRPMKGTARRGTTPGDDRAAAARLQASVKERAENVMIVDMVRNDLGRIAEYGSVQVPRLFETEAFPTVWQMTSTVTARTAATLPEIFTALHPCASVTGAPRLRTMEIIAGLEGRPRGVYTGALGYVAPDGAARFSVAIRTAVATAAAPGESAGRLTYGVGSGIVWDSDADREYDECLLKARVLTDLAVQPLRETPGATATGAFSLLSTLKWQPHAGFVLLDRHIERLRRSAAYFGYPFDEAALQGALFAALAGQSGDRRVRVLLDGDGAIRVEQTALIPSAGTLRLVLARRPLPIGDQPFLLHKTTRRDVYNQARAEAGDDCDDVVLWTTDGDVTETSVCNIVVETSDGWLTPPLAAGLLPGTLRASLLDDGRIREGRVTVADLRRAGWCWVINSLHGWRRGVLVDQPTGATRTPASAGTAETAAATGTRDA